MGSIGLLSLQEAIDLSIFFIETAITFNDLLTTYSLLGDIDIALITPFHGFQWIRRKQFIEVIENE